MFLHLIDINELEIILIMSSISSRLHKQNPLISHGQTTYSPHTPKKTNPNSARFRSEKKSPPRSTAPPRGPAANQGPRLVGQLLGKVKNKVVPSNNIIGPRLPRSVGKSPEPGKRRAGSPPIRRARALYANPPIYIQKRNVFISGAH